MVGSELLDGGRPVAGILCPGSSTNADTNTDKTNTNTGKTSTNTDETSTNADKTGAGTRRAPIWRGVYHG